MPGYVDPAVLTPGAIVYRVFDAERTPLTVVRVEPMLVCRAPDGTGLVIYAHEVLPLEDAS
jgi:hypothetical protein